jgi:trans-aconitate methyltransferase
VLNVSPGDGVHTKWLEDLGCTVTGIDASSSMVAAAKEKGLDARIMDGQELDFGDEKFDAVFSHAALHWMPRLKHVLEVGTCSW